MSGTWDSGALKGVSERSPKDLRDSIAYRDQDCPPSAEVLWSCFRFVLKGDPEIKCQQGDPSKILLCVLCVLCVASKGCFVPAKILRAEKGALTKEQRQSIIEYSVLKHALLGE